MTWKQEAAARIAEATRDLPADMPSKERKKVVDAARPHWGGCSWLRKAWQIERGDYLTRFGYVPKTKPMTVGQPEALPLFGR